MHFLITLGVDVPGNFIGTLRIFQRAGSSGPPGPCLPLQCTGRRVDAGQRDQYLYQLMNQLLRYYTHIVDGLGNGKHSPEEVDVLFGLMAKRCERGSVLSSGLLGVGTEPSGFVDHNRLSGPAASPRCDP